MADHWSQSREKWILADPSTPVGLTAFEVAAALHINCGGHTTMQDHNANWARFNRTLVREDRFPRAVNQNATAADLVLVLNRDPKSELVNMFITTAKERHKPVRLIIHPDGIEGVRTFIRSAPKVDRIYICGGAMLPIEIKPILSQVLSDWAKEKKGDARS